MAAQLLPQDVTEHLAGAIQLSNRHMQLRFLEEAETLLLLQYPVAAIVVAGVVLEFLVAGQPYQPASNEAPQIEKWAKLRNDAVHHGQTLTLDEAKEMVAGVRQLLLRATGAGPRLAFTASSNQTSEPIRGKYQFVPASSEDFIARKADELRREH